MTERSLPFNLINEQISELVSQKMHLLAQVDQIDLAINTLKGTNYNIPERALQSPLTQTIAPHPWQAPIIPAKWYRRLEPQCKPGQCDSPHSPNDAA